LINLHTVSFNFVGRPFLLQSIISLLRIKTILPHSFPFCLLKAGAKKSVILRSKEAVIFVYENRLFSAGNKVNPISSCFFDFVFQWEWGGQGD